MKTSKAYFNRFKKEFVRWQRLLGLTQYRVDFYHEQFRDGDGSYYAKIEVFEQDKVASVSLSTEIKRPELDIGPESHARHEVLHLLLHRLMWLGEGRFIDRSDISEETEAVVVRLEKVLK